MLLRIAIVVVLAVSLPMTAYPCGNATYLRGDEAVAQVARAEKLLARGKNRQAMRLVSRFEYRFEDDGLSNRARTIELVAGMRHGRSAAAGKRAARVFEQTLEADAEQPYVAARLAEAYAIAGDKAARARELLEDLAERDLIPDAEAFATLGLLRHRAGDEDGRDEAFSRCRSMTRRRAVCRLPRGEAARKPPIEKAGGEA